MRPVNSDSTKLDPEDHLARKQRHAYPPNADRWPPLHGPHQPPNHGWHAQLHQPLRLPKHPVRRDSGVGRRTRHRSAVYFAESAACGGRLVRAICSSASGSNPVAKFTFPVALGVPVRLHPLSAGWATPGGGHPSAPSPVRDADHNSNQHCKKEEKSRAEHHDVAGGNRKTVGRAIKKAMV